MQNFEDKDKTVEPNNGAKSLIRATTGPDTPMAKVNEDVSGPSVPLAVDERIFSAPFVCILSLLGPNTMKDNEDEQPH